MLDSIVDRAMKCQQILLSGNYSDLDHFSGDFKHILQIGRHVSPRAVKAIIRAMKKDSEQADIGGH